MSHFSKVNLILSRQPTCCTSGSDGCWLTCEENVLASQNPHANYFARKNNGKGFFSPMGTHSNSNPMSQRVCTDNGCNLFIKRLYLSNCVTVF